MNFSILKELCREYERLLRELATLQKIAPDAKWQTSPSALPFPIDIPPDIAARILSERIASVRSRARELAGLIGVQYLEGDY